MGREEMRQPKIETVSPWAEDIRRDFLAGLAGYSESDQGVATDTDQPDGVRVPRIAAQLMGEDWLKAECLLRGLILEIT